MAANRAVLRQMMDYSSTHAAFDWIIPDQFNIATAICDHGLEHYPDRKAIVDIDKNGRATPHSFAAIDRDSNRLAHVLEGAGVGRGAAVGILLPQRVETAWAHLATLKMGAVCLPLFVLFGPDALLHRLRDAKAKVVITDAKGALLLRELRSELPDLLVIDVDDHGPMGLGPQMADAPVTFSSVHTRADDPAILIYTSGTTGPPKGALHGHRVLLGHLPGFEYGLNFAPYPDDVIWTPADWAWIGGLLDVLLPALYHGIPVVAHRFDKFTAQAAFDLMQDHNVTLAFLPPTALKIMRLEPAPNPLALRAIISGGEALGADMIAWGEATFGCTINEIYGQTECNLVLMSCAALEPVTPGMMGRPVPGFDVAVLDQATGASVPDGQEGVIAVRAPNPVMFLEYLGQSAATQDKYVENSDGRWLVTGDMGVRHANGLFQFLGREDDVISSAGYRIGPAEIETCLQTHPMVAMAGVVGTPDPIRGQIVAACVTLVEGARPSPTLAAEIAEHVKTRLAAYEYPRRVEFLDEMPMTPTGKIVRSALRKRLS
ncbi:AMP-binding protein [Algirhabdus cladophorae]|uniref:AMP-binding protein n=1 Tax=Algirhabdus cladophorae TaxID=3377108 RepID=UPI003B8453A5